MAVRSNRAAIAFAVVLFSAACGKTAAPPTLPTPPTTSAPTGKVVSEVRASVRDPVGRPLMLATVDILDGQTVRATTATDDAGVARFTGSFSGAVTFRGQKDGYVDATRVMNVENTLVGIPHTDIQLRPDATPVILAPGGYTMTVLVDPVCTAIPEALRTRVYAAEVSPLDGARPVTQYSVIARSATLQYGGFVLGVARNYLRFEDDMGFWEYLPSFTYLDFSGIGEATVDEATVSTLTLSYSGGFDYCALNSDRGRNNCYTTPAEKVITRVSCSGPNSRIILARQ